MAIILYDNMSFANVTDDCVASVCLSHIAYGVIIMLQLSPNCCYAQPTRLSKCGSNRTNSLVFGVPYSSTGIKTVGRGTICIVCVLAII